MVLSLYQVRGQLKSILLHPILWALLLLNAIDYLGDISFTASWKLPSSSLIPFRTALLSKPTFSLLCPCLYLVGSPP